MTIKSLTKVDIQAALRSVSPEVRLAIEESHKALQKAGVAHVVIGGMAVNAYGHHYSTDDVDYLVDPKEAFLGTVVLTHREGVPFAVGEVGIDYLTATKDMPAKVRAAIAQHLRASRSAPAKLFVVSDWLLVWLKLNVGRTKDMAGVEGLLHKGLDAAYVRSKLVSVGPPRVVALFDRCIAHVENLR